MSKYSGHGSRKGNEADMLLDHLTNIPFPLRSHSIRFSTTSYSFKLESNYKSCNEVRRSCVICTTFWLVASQISSHNTARASDVTVKVNINLIFIFYWKLIAKKVLYALSITRAPSRHFFECFPSYRRRYFNSFIYYFLIIYLCVLLP